MPKSPKLQAPSPLLLFGSLVGLIAVVGDGWSGRPGPIVHQLLLLPALGVLFAVLPTLLFRSGRSNPAELLGLFRLVFVFQAGTVGLFWYAAGHFHQFGYALAWKGRIGLGLATTLVLVPAVSPAVSSVLALGCLLGAWLLTLGVAIADFPLNYLRSDMLPVIVWAGQNLIRGVNPYTTMHVGQRLYDFPYLPGMLTAYLPFVAARVDVRVGNAVYMTVAALIIWLGTRAPDRRACTATLGLFLLCPFLQYRHDLYLEPHWTFLAGAFLLASRGRLYLSALLIGVSMSVYQFSWILFPFFCLFVWTSLGWRGVVGAVSIAAVGALAFAAPELRYQVGRVGQNTVTQWAHLPHALADPLNLSYWATFIIRPAQLLWLQGGLMVMIFGYCVLGRRCRSLEDTMRWMIVAVTLFVLLNVIVDGYFFLMILFLVLLYLCVAQGWWPVRSAEEIRV